MKNCTGKWLMVVAVLHLMISFIFMGEPIRQILNSGSMDVSNFVNMELVALYFSFGVMMLVGGIVVDNAQEASRSSTLEAASVVLLVVVISWIIFLPLSSFWLALPAVITLFFIAPPTVE